jgi:hypothetical protein
MVKDITPGLDWSNLSYLCSAGGKLYFAKDYYYLVTLAEYLNHGVDN